VPIASVSAGNRLTAAKVNELITQINSLTDPDWTDYSASFTLTAATTNPTKGNSTYSARYRRPTNSDLIHYEGKITIGSTFSAGSGVYRFSLPVNASALAQANAVGQAYIFDSGTANRQGTIRLDAATYFQLYLHDSLSGITNTGSGTAWATGDIIAWSVYYEPA
jgi:hypothetical protein